MRRMFAGITLGLCVSLTACGTAARSDDNASSSGVKSYSKVSFDGVDTKYVPPPFDSPGEIRGDVDVPFTFVMNREKVRKAAADFTMKDDGRQTVALEEASCANPGIDDIIPVDFTVHYKDEATFNVELGVSFTLKVEDPEGNEVDRDHPQAISIAWLHQSAASCGSSLDDKFAGPSSLSHDRSLRGAIILHGGAANYKGYTLTLSAGMSGKISNISGAKRNYNGVKMPLLP